MDDKPKAVMLELYPANLSGTTLPKNYKDVLAVVTDQKLYVATDDPTGKKRYVVVHDTPIFDIRIGAHRKEWVVTLDDEHKTEVTVTRSNGCGCGSRLRGVRMFRGVPYKRVI